MEKTAHGREYDELGAPNLTRRKYAAGRRIEWRGLNLNPRSSNQEGGNSSLKTDWLTSIEAAAYLKISVGSLRNMVWNGTLNAHRMGRRLRFLVGDLNSLLVSKGANNGN